MQVTIYVDQAVLHFMDRFLDDSLLFERGKNAEMIHNRWNAIEALPYWVQVQVTYDEYFRLLNIEDGIGGDTSY